MACFDQDFIPARGLRRRLAGRVAALLETPFDRRYRRRTARIAALRALSDTELATRGIARADILFHVFRDGR